MSEQQKPENEESTTETPETAAENSAEATAEPAAEPSEQREAQAEPEAVEEPTIESLQAALEAAQAEAAEAKDQALRAAAEAQNARRRAENEAEKARKFALERFAKDILPVVDNLERGLASFDKEDEAQKSAIEGVELTLKTLVDALGRNQIEVIDPNGEPFDPQVHEAVAMVPNPAAEPNTVIDVVQKGYLLNGRLLRAAMVAVAKEP